MYWASSGHEEKTLAELRDATAKWCFENRKTCDEEYLMIFTGFGEIYVEGEGVNQFNEAVAEKIEELESDRYANRSKREIYEEGLLDNWYLNRHEEW